MLRKFLCKNVDDETREYLEKAPVFALLVILMMVTITCILTRGFTSIISAIFLALIIFILKFENYDLLEYVSPHILFVGICAVSITAIINLYIMSADTDIGKNKMWVIRLMYYLIIPMETVASILLIY